MNVGIYTPRLPSPHALHWSPALPMSPDNLSIRIIVAVTIIAAVGSRGETLCLTLS